MLGQFEHNLHERVGIIGNDLINAKSYFSLSFMASSPLRKVLTTTWNNGQTSSGSRRSYAQIGDPTNIFGKIFLLGYGQIKTYPRISDFNSMKQPKKNQIQYIL